MVLTWIKSILGIIQANTGIIEVDGENVSCMSTSKRDLVNRKFGMLLQGGALFDSLPVWENVAFGLIHGRRMNRTDARKRAIETLGKVGLAPELSDLFPSELSGGML